MATEKHQCSATVFSRQGWATYNCERNGKNFEEKKWWCGVHTPSVVEAKRVAREAKWKKEWDEDSRKDVRRDLEVSFCSGVPNKFLRSKKLKKIVKKLDSQS